MMGPDAPKLATPDAGLAEREAWAPAALTVEEAEAARAAAASQGPRNSWRGGHASAIRCSIA